MLKSIRYTAALGDGVFNVGMTEHAFNDVRKFADFQPWQRAGVLQCRIYHGDNIEYEQCIETRIHNVFATKTIAVEYDDECLHIKTDRKKMPFNAFPSDMHAIRYAKDVIQTKYTVSDRSVLVLEMSKNADPAHGAPPLVRKVYVLSSDKDEASRILAMLPFGDARGTGKTSKTSKTSQSNIV